MTADPHCFMKTCYAVTDNHTAAKSTLPWLHVISEVPPGGPNGHGITLARVLSGVAEKYRISACYERLDTNRGEIQGLDGALALDLFSLPPRFKSNHLVHTVRWLHQEPVLKILEEHLSRRLDGIVLATPVGHASLFRAGLMSAWKLGLPTAIWVMDDWIAATRLHYPYLYKQAETFMKSAVERSSALFAISPEMARLFERRWGGTWEVLVNYVRPQTAPSVAARPLPLNRKFRVAFFGDVYEGQADAASHFSQACMRKGIDFAIYGNVDSRFRRLPWGATTAFRGRVSCGEADCLMQDSDALYLPFGFDPRVEWFVTTSFPTKLADYVAAERPVLVHGPAASTIVGFARRHRWGVVIDSLRPEAISDALDDMQTNYPQHATDTQHRLKSILSEIGQGVICGRLQNALARELGATVALRASTR